MNIATAPILKTTRVLSILFATTCLLPAQDTPVWQSAARMLEARTGHCAVGLADGRILIAGGIGTSATLASTEFYGPDDVFQAGPAMTVARTGHRCTLLNDGRVLVSGGSSSSSAEVFDPSSSRWTAVSGDTWTAQNHTATLLPTGAVLLAGGIAGGQPSAAIASFDPSKNELRSLISPLMEARSGHTAELLPDGKVLFAGGTSERGTLDSVELLDPSIPRIVPGAQLNTRRSAHVSARLPDGRILIAGGTNGEFDLDNAEIYNLAEDRWFWVNSLMASPRKDLLAVSLPSGKILFAGGDLNGTPLGLTETFNPETAVFERAGYLTAPRAGIAGAVLPLSGLILATGGRNESGSTNLCGLLSLATFRLTDKNGTVPALGFTSGDIVYASGTSFPSGTTVTFAASRSDDIIIAGTRLLTASLVTSTSGFRVPLFTVVESDLGKTITATATALKTVLKAATAASGRISLEITGPTSISAATRWNIGVVVRSATPSVPISGTLTVKLQESSGSRPFAGASGTSVTVTGCCVSLPGNYVPTVEFVPDNINYTRASANGPAVTVTSLGITFAPLSNANFPLFQTVVRDFVLSGPVAATARPTGQVTVTRTQPPAFSVTLPLAATSNSVMSRIPLAYKATFEDRANPCALTFAYSGDAVYAPSSGSFCITAVPAVPTLTASASPFLPDYPSMDRYSNMDAAIAFPAELGIQNRFLLVSQGCIKLVNVGVGQASGTSNPLLGCIVSFKYNDTRAVVSYTGGGDLGPADPITVPLTRLKWGTVVRLTVSAQPRGGDPVTLTAAVDEIGDYLCRSTLPAPAGSIRFFDGSLFIGAANLTAGICDDPSTASLSVVRPVGTSNFRAEFSESVSHLGGVSDVVAATIR